MMNFSTQACLPFSLILALGACAGSDTEATTASTISASEGGILSLEDSETGVNFPVGAVSEDTEIRLSVGALSDFGSHDNALADVLVFDPEMSLAGIAQLSWDLSALDSDSQVHIVQYDDGAWRRPEVSALEIGSGGIAQTSIIRLAPTAVVVEAANADASDVVGNVVHIYTQEPLPGIEFELWTSFEQKVGTATSDQSGRFSFADVAPGDYFVLASVLSEDNCYNDPTQKELAVNEGADTTVAFGFVPGPC